MESVRNRIDEFAEKSLTYADRKWDKALLGFAENYKGEILPCYGYQALKVLATTKHNSKDSYKAVTSLINDGHLILSKLAGKEMWACIQENLIPRWDMLDSAILGIGQRGWGNMSVVYNRALCTQALADIQSVSTDSKLSASSQALMFFDTCLVPVQMGNHSPWYLTVIK